MKLRLSDRGEGWFWVGRTVDVEVFDQVRANSRLFYRVTFSERVDVPEDGVSTEVGLASGDFGGAWLSPRWVGHEIRRDQPVTALLWLARDVRQSADPPRDVDWSARVECVEVD